MNEQNKKTPKTISQKEHDTLTFWTENKIFEKSVETPAGEVARDSFSFFDGPPFATGVPHHGHLLAGTIKDIIPRYKTMQGHSVRRTWGWDCHGLPLENLVEKKFDLKHKKDIEAFGVGNFNEAARDMVFQYESQWKEVIPRMGRFVDMDTPYKTMDPSYTESIWWSFKALYDKGLIYEGSKIMHICPRCETTLAQSEVAQGYMDVTDISVTAKFELEEELQGNPIKTYLLAWTTTPWTLPGNVALAIKPEEEYVKIKERARTSDISSNTQYELPSNEVLVVAKSIFIKEENRVVSSNLFYFGTSKRVYEIIEEIKGSDLVGKKYKPVFDYFADIDMSNKDNLYKVVAGPFVTTDSGTGIVHIAPAFGNDDYELGRAENLPIIKHVNMDGTFTKEITEVDEDFKGVYVKQKGDSKSADIIILRKLQDKGFYFDKESIKHSYPHCWRCDTPLLNYATSSWFMDVLKIKGDLIRENKNIGWVPRHAQDGRFGKWLEGARDWALSRSRYWGAPLPVWKCQDCSRVEVMGSVAELQTKFTAANTYTAMRHGECIGNTQDRADAGKDLGNHLTDLGKKQVIETASTFNKSDFDLIVHSPVVRAKETAKIVQEHLGLTSSEMVEDARLSEFDFGIYDGKNFADFWEKLKTLHYDFDAHLEGSESYRSLQGRLSQLLADCEKKYTGKKILFVTHGAPMWMLKALTENMSDSQAREYRAKTKVDSKAHYFLPNASVLSLDFKPFPHSSHGLDLHRPYIDEMVYSCSDQCDGQMKRILDVFDCWYESGAMPFASIHYPFENKELFDTTFPADFIAEGLDQTRGWFYSLLNLSVGLFGKASYKQVVVNGLTIAADGQKMSKSKNNYTDPMDLVEKYGADSLRFALINSPLVRGENTVFTDALVDEVSKKLVQRLENVYSFYEMYRDESIAPSNSSQNVLDHWIRSRLNQTIHAVTTGLEGYELDTAARVFESFIDDLSTWYLRRSRDRLKGDTNEIDRKLAIETLGYVLLETSKTLAPFMPFLTERIYKGITEGKDVSKESVHLESWPLGGHIDEIAIVAMDETRKLVSLGLEARNKVNIKVRQPLQALKVKSLSVLTEEYLELIEDEVNVKEIIEDTGISGDVELDTIISKDLQREGSVRELARAIKDLRKDSGLGQGDIATLEIQTDDNGKTFILETSDEIKKTCSLSEIVFTEIQLQQSKEITLEETSYLLCIR